jgi:hypothetical protein
MRDDVKEAWLEYTSANQYQSEYFLLKYLKTLNKDELAELFENFGREHSNLIMERK